MPPFASLRAFEAVFRTGGIRRAADNLGINHAVVSRHLRQLEQWLGVPLLTRAGNRVALTEVGARYHALIAAALADIKVATAELTGLQKSGHLRLWCVPGLAIQWLSGQLANFEQLHGDFTIELKPTDEPPNLLIHEADADIRYFRDTGATPLAKGLRSFELARPEILAVASPALAEALSPSSAEALLRAPLLHEDNHDEWRSWLAANGVAAPTALPGPICWHAHLAIAAARLGRGIALASHYLVHEDLQSGDLVELRIPGASRVVLGGYFLIGREDRWSMPAFATLRRFLRVRAEGLPGAHGAPSK